MTFVLCQADRIQVLPRDVNRGSHVEQWPPSAPPPLQLPRLALLKQHVLSAQPTEHTHTHTSVDAYTRARPWNPVETDLRPSPCLLLHPGRFRPSWLSAHGDRCWADICVCGSAEVRHSLPDSLAGSRSISCSCCCKHTRLVISTIAVINTDFISVIRYSNYVY